MGEENKSTNSFKMLLLGLMVLQNSSVVLIGRFTRASVSEADAFVVNHFVFTTEVCKLLGSTMLELYVSKGQIIKSLNNHVFKNPCDFLLIAVPAILYLVQNTLLYVALSNLSAPIFQVTYQAKLLTTALVSVVLLNRQYNMRQWICLTCLGVGVAIVVLSEASNKDSPDEGGEIVKHDQNFGLGMISVTISCFSSAFAGVFFEKVLKKPPSEKSTVPPPSVWMRNMQLAFFSVCIALVNLVFFTADDKPFMHGFTSWVWVLVSLQAGGGLLVAAVIKYADNVLKGMSTGVAVVFSTVCSILLFGTPLTIQFSIGASIILISVYYFSNDFSCKKKKNFVAPPPSATEMKPMIPRS